MSLQKDYGIFYKKYFAINLIYLINLKHLGRELEFVKEENLKSFDYMRQKIISKFKAHYGNFIKIKAFRLLMMVVGTLIQS